MLFRQLVLSAAIVLVISGCSDRPSGSAPTTPDVDNDSGSSTTSDSGTSTGTPVPPSTQPGSGGNITPPILPTNRSTLTISGPVAGSQETDTYAFKVCSGQVCEQWQSTVAEGRFEYTFQLSQWPLDQIVTVEGSKLVSASANSARAFSNASVDAQSASYFHTELDTLTNILKMDSNDDGYIDQAELPTISLDPVTIAFNTVAKHLLKSELSHYGNLPYAEKSEAVRRYLSDNSKSTLVELSDSQKQDIRNHVSSQSGRFYGTYALELTAEQWAAINGPLSTPQEQRVIELNTAQLRTLFIRDSNRPTTNNQFNLSVAQTYAVHGKLIYNQRLVIELAVLYQMLSKQSDIKLTIGGEQKTALNEQIALLNPDQQQATQFAGSYSIEIESDTLDMLGVFDRTNGEKARLSFSAEQMRNAYQAYQQGVEDNGYADYVFTIKPMQWSRAGLSLEQIGTKILAKAKTTPSYTLWQHYEKEILPTNEKPIIYNELENSISAQLQKSYRYQWRVNELVMANYNHPLKSSILAIAPERQLKISGRFPKELEQVSLSIILGSRRISDYDSSRYPRRHQPVNLITNNGQRQHRLDLSGESSFITTIALRDIDNFYSRCAPGTLDKNAYEYTEYTADEMQDTLTIHLRDEKTGVELRSVLGSFCEIAKLDTLQGNSNNILEYDEFERLNVGYVSTARAAMLLKSIVSRTGSLAYALPQTNEQIIEKYSQMPRKQVELLAAFLALQAKGKLFSSLVDLSERADLYDDLLALLNIDLSKYRVSDNNAYPSAETLLNRIASTSAIGQVLIENIDVNISHITQAMTALLAESEADQYYFPSGVRPGGWVTVYPVNGLDASCQSLVDENQLLGLRIEGRGEDSLGHWVTIGWDSQPGASSYTLAWGEESFSQVAYAPNVLPTEKQRATITGLDLDKQYYLRVQSNVGSASAQMTYSPRRIHIADSRITKGLAGDDSTRGRDNSFACDPLTGKAENNSEDGLLGARYVKLDQQGKPLARQDLSYNTQPFACVLNAHSGLVWEIKYRRKEDDPYSVYDSDNQFLIKPVEDATIFSGTCTEHGTDKVSTDPNQCTVSNQIDWYNQEKRCGLSNWRLPTLQESVSILNFGNLRTFGRNLPANVDSQYFPHLQTMWLAEKSLDSTHNLVLNAVNFGTYYKSAGLSNSLVLVSDGFYIKQ
ncbi:DUF1566 domain-containing protein [Vibrio hepatarius]|jgi:hypothetical protein|uniref:DUF1566 domain-containing protein n=1 Tax=Vibrio hepatarius TaxID=171383 RepID=A0A0M0HUX3_9VIBR|nr:DUF1566 domain-containing protein [Vibrio hepatarius]KOO05672.1 hypothetical protein AKJ31_21260 [Vibrio hepatarius]